ncbi:hypothetical protein FSP39_004072 [Pinctada imbricata]|uniref:3'-5' exonuclease domain-containing protein n=1 Tax=Pinctada imbricata TaxID=66713 RepID=A0AA88Y736_PINIB|nr:hypothetical protein FSP39_004072 [Pinctada imbricata]
MMAELAEFVGKRVVLELKEGATLNGFVHALDATTSKLTLHKANQTSEYDSSSDPEQLDDVDAPYVLINKLDQRFRDAVHYISQQQIIGFAIQAVCPGRLGKLCWLQFGTAEHVFIFDVLSMGPLSFEEGIKKILESPDIQKVMHDCRLVSDMLHHQYDTNLINIFDTEVADVFVYRLHHNNDWPRYVQGLPHCLVDHLNLEPEEVHAMKVRDGFQEEDQEVWAKRPASRDILMAAMKNVMHLRKLRYVLEEKMMAEFVAGVDIYLSQVKNASKQDAKKAQISNHKLPLAFQELPSMMSHRDHRRFYRRSNGVGDNFSKSDIKGFRDNVAVINDVNVSYSRDSPWHVVPEGKRSCKKF